MYQIRVQREFDAAHFLVETNTRCDQLHGHRWTVWCMFQSEKLDKHGWVINFSTVKKWLDRILIKYDHSLLNFYLTQPTAEHLCSDIYRHLYRKVQEHNRNFELEISLVRVEIAETPGNIASFTCEQWTGAEIKRYALKQSHIRKDILTDGKHTQELRSRALKDLHSPGTEAKRRARHQEIVWSPEERQRRSKQMKLHNPMQNRRTVEKMLTALKKVQKLSPNREEQLLIRAFQEDHIPLVFVGAGQLIIDGKIPDFINLEKRVIVEYNSRFWHSDDNPWYDVHDDSEERIQFFSDRGYTVYIIWDDNWRNKKNDILQDLKRLLQ